MAWTTMSGVCRLEVAAWAPWLRFSPDELEAHRRTFPEGQVVHAGPDGEPWGALTCARVRWSGDPSELGTWDAVAGRAAPGEVPHDATGNTLVLLSTAVDPAARGLGIGPDLVRRAVAWARLAGIEHAIGPFRPSGFGAHKAATGSLDAVAYCSARRPDGLPVDPWLRVLDRMGMEPLKLVEGAMLVTVPLDEVVALRTTHRPEQWWTVDPAPARALAERHRHLGLAGADEVWECGETGSWFLDRAAGTATYAEPNLWGSIPLREA